MANPNRRRSSASADSFAHLAGLGRGRPLAEDDPAETQEDRDTELQRREDAGEDTGETEEERAKRHERQLSQGSAPNSEDEGDDDSDRAEMRGSGPAVAIRRRERARCAAIFATQAAGRNPVLAAHLALGTDLTRGEAIRVLRDTPAPQAAGRADRAAGNPKLGSGGGDPSGGPARAQGLWDQALVKAGILSRR